MMAVNREAYDDFTWILDNADMGFFIVTAPHDMQREIAAHYISYNAAIYDYAENDSAWSYPELSAWEESHPESNFLFVLNLQLALQNEKDMLSFNLCRDMLSAKQRIWVFFMTKDLDYRLSTFAFDFYSYVRLMAHFEADEVDLHSLRLNFDGFDRMFNFDDSKEALERYKELEEHYTSLSLANTPEDQLSIAAITLTNISDLYKNCAEYGKALDLLDLVRRINKKLYGSMHANTAFTYKKIGEVCDLQGYFDKALEWYTKAIAVYEKEFGAEHITTGEVYTYIGHTYDELGKYNEALLWYEKALKTCENKEDKERYTATVYNNIALAFSKQGEYSIALGWYGKALIIHEKKGISDSTGIATLYRNIAAAYAYLGQHSTALDLNMKALEIFEKYYGTKHPVTAESYNNIGFFYLNQGNYAQAIEWFTKVLTIHESVPMGNHPSVAVTYNNIAFAYSGQRDYSTALDWCLKGYVALCNNLGETHPSTIGVKSDLSFLYEHVGLEEPFDEWLSKHMP